MESMQQRVEAWIKEQRTKISNISWPPLQQWRTMRWPWKNYAEHKKRIQEEYERRKKQVHDLCLAVKADSVSDLRDVLCCMVLSECVYKKPASEVVRAVNKFKADFGGQIVSLERVQPSSDHVPHRYLLAEAGDTLFASFIGTKQYKDIMADANILQGAIFHEDVAEYIDETEATESDQVKTQQGIIDILMRPLGTKPRKISQKPKPAAHRGFLARAKGIPALELYRLAQKKKRKLVLCGHSLGGAVAVLATLAILRVVAASSSLKENENENVQVKCITFSQPPVGNAALRGHVIGKKWHHYFKTYCIPEDLVPRILSPAYFRHYNDQPLSVLAGVGSTSLSISKHDGTPGKSRVEGLKENEGEQLVLGLGPVQSSLWRLSKLVPLEGVWGQFNRYRGKQVDPVEKSSDDSVGTSSIDNVVDQPQSLEIQEGFDSISLQPISDMDKGMPIAATNGKLGGKNNKNYAEGVAWHRVPSLPSYVPFGQLYLLGNSSVESLSGSEYSQLTSVRSVITELRERLQSHSMKSYRSRFQRIYDLCMNGNASSFLGMDQFPYLQQWFGLSVSGAVELGHIVDSPVIRAATSVAPLGWSGIPGEKNVEPLKVDITGFGLHLCTLVQAQVNGNWCSTTVESFPSAPNYFSSFGLQQDLQKIRVLIGPALKRPPKHKIAADALVTDFSSIDSNQVNLNMEHAGTLHDGKFIRPEGSSNVVIHCTSDFSTISKEVHIRTRRVRLVGLEGAGKSSLLRAILGQNRLITTIDTDNLQLEDDLQEGISGGLCYTDSAGVNLQELNMEASRFRDELWMGIRDLSKKVDLILLVHNLSHKIPCFNHTDGSQQQPALVLLLNEAKSLGIPWVLAITNKFSVSAHQQKTAVDAVLQAYKAPASSSGVVNSCPYVMPTAADAPLSFGLEDGDSDSVAQKLLFAPINLVRRPFQKKPTILPVEGVTALRQIVHRVLQTHEEASLQELARERLLLELARERTSASAKRDSEAKASSLTAATVGASLGAGLGLVMAVVMGAFSALRKP